MIIGRTGTPMPGSPFVFQVSDFRGNQVTLYADTWDRHIAPFHPEVVPYRNLVEPCIVNPSGVRTSTDSIMASVFEADVQGLAPEDLLRVIVRYEDRFYERKYQTRSYNRISGGFRTIW